MHTEEKSFMKEKKKKTRSKSSQKVTKNRKKIENPLRDNAKARSEYMREYQARKKTLQNTRLVSDLMTNRKIGQFHQNPLPNLHQSTHERISSMGKTLQNILLMPSLRDRIAIEALLMTAHINTDFVNHPVPSATEPLASLVRVGTDAC
ncbi:uncharacterized protein TNCV_3088591 [Trichonephila clavipes]|uniref:Uncharacterized protein n=1 Tax=Trichonephila clavipes TaxID=2585209 RepID=A0A8X6RI73_TRICX|nr:uncharacterized protein TNCV_3088591 [Trichonephila clavipes]